MLFTIIVGVAAICIIARCVTKCICKVKKTEGKINKRSTPKKKTK